jgi:UDP-glucose:(heptosyl)LPS alpha-1,3-glucosyltransferase
VALETARYLSGRGHDVHVFATDVDRILSDAATVHYVPALKRPWFLTAPSFHRNCSRLLRASDYDAVGAFGAPSPVGGVYWAQSVHPAWLEHSKEFRAPFSAERWKQRLNPAHPILVGLERRHLRSGRYRRVLALTEMVRDDLVRHHGVPPSDVDILPVGFDPTEFNIARARAARAEERRRFGLTDDHKVVLFAANELERKGIRQLLRALALLDDPSVRLLVAGRASLVAYRGLISELKLGEQVQEAGPRTDMWACYGAADVLALPTQYEAWGLVIVEAMACGIPVVTSARAGAAVAIEQGRTGALVDQPDSADEIAAAMAPLLAGNHAGRVALAAAVQPYTWPRILSRYEEILLSA